MTQKTRRDFIKQAAAGTAAFLAYPTARVLGANDRVRLAMIGVGAAGPGIAETNAGDSQRASGRGRGCLYSALR